MIYKSKYAKKKKVKESIEVGDNMYPDVGFNLPTNSRMRNDTLEEYARDIIVSMVEGGKTSGKISGNTDGVDWEGYFNVDIQEDDYDENVRNTEIAERISSGWDSSEEPTYDLYVKIWVKDNDMYEESTAKSKKKSAGKKLVKEASSGEIYNAYTDFTDEYGTDDVDQAIYFIQEELGLNYNVVEEALADMGIFTVDSPYLGREEYEENEDDMYEESTYKSKKKCGGKKPKKGMKEGLNVERWDRDAISDAFEYAKEMMGAEGLLDALERAMSTDELYENLKYIFRMHEIDYPEVDEEEDGEEYEESTMKEGSVAHNIPGTNLYVSGVGRDVNGNKVVYLNTPNQRRKAIQTNKGEFLADVHRSLDKDLDITPKMEKELLDYVTKYEKKRFPFLKVYSANNEESTMKEAANIDVIKAFVLGTKPVRSGNLSIVKNESGVDLVNYSTVIARIKNSEPEVVYVNPKKYSVTTTTITNKVKGVASSEGMGVKELMGEGSVKESTKNTLVKYARKYGRI